MCLNQAAGTEYRNTCFEYGLEVRRSKWETPPNVVENDQAKILRDFKMQVDKLVIAHPLDIL